MTRRLLLAAVLLITGFAVMSTSRASAQQVDYGETCAITLTPGPPYARGQQVSIDGTGFPANFDAEVQFDDQSFDPPVFLHTNAQGEFFDLIITIPQTATAGQHRIGERCDANAPTLNQTQVEVLGEGQTAPVFVVDPNQINCSASLVGFADITQPNSQVTFSVRTPAATLATVTSDNATGRANFTAPGFGDTRAAGEYEIVSNGTDQQGAPFELTARVTLTKDSCAVVTSTTSTTLAPGSVGGTGQSTGSGSGTTPRTGTDVEPLVAVGLAALLGGVAFVLISRRRRTQAVAS